MRQSESETLTSSLSLGCCQTGLAQVSSVLPVVRYQNLLDFPNQLSDCPAIQHFEVSVVLCFQYSSALRYAMVIQRKQGSRTQ